jgi:iron complex outermembrane receptor protein
MGRFSFIGGGYYYYDDNRVWPQHVAGINPATDFWYDGKNIAQAYAGFGEATLELTDRLTVIGGLRYSWERRANKGLSKVGSPPSPSGQLILGPSIHFDAWTPRFSVRYKVSDDTNAYFTYSQGFKAGGVQSTAFLQPRANWANVVYQPEKATAYEVGLKSSPTPSLSFDLAAYYYKYSDLQVQVQVAASTPTILNAATANIYGLDGDAVWRATDELTFTAGMSLLDAKYDKFKNAVVLRPNPPIPGIGLTGNTATTVDASGNRLPRAPKYTFTLSTDYNKVFEPGTFNANLTLFYTDTVYFDSDQRVHQGPYGIVNARMSWQPRDCHIRAEAWVKNLLDKDYISSTSLQNISDIVGYGRPRTYGVTLNYAF